MPHWHHPCVCPYHHRGQLCPWCDGSEYWPRTREEWEEPPASESDSLTQQLEGLREAVDRLNRRLEELEEKEG